MWNVLSFCRKTFYFCPLHQKVYTYTKVPNKHEHEHVHTQPWLPVGSCNPYTIHRLYWSIYRRRAGKHSLKISSKRFLLTPSCLCYFQLWKGGKSADEAWRKEERRGEMSVSVISPMSSSFCIWYTHTHAHTHPVRAALLPHLFWEGIRNIPH